MIKTKRYHWYNWIWRPAYWLMNYPYSRAWDEKLNELIDNYEFVAINWYKSSLGDYTIWITNHPYASFQDYKKMNICRASRSTILRAKKHLDACIGTKDPYLMPWLQK